MKDSFMFKIYKYLIYLIFISCFPLLTSCDLINSIFYNIEYEWSNDYLQCIATKALASNDKIIETETAISNIKIIRDRSCENSEISEFEAVFENKNFETQITRAQTKSALGHSYLAEVVIKQPSCNETGLKSIRCSLCEYSMTTEIPKLEHVLEEKITKEAECNLVGVKTTECILCNYSFNTEIPALKHDYGEKVVVKSPTCDENGVEYQECNLCGYKDEYQTQSLGHIFSLYIKDSESNKHSSTCQRCNELFNEKCSDSSNDKKCDICNGEIYTTIQTIVIDFSTGPDSIVDDLNRYYYGILLTGFKSSITSSGVKFGTNGYVRVNGNSGITLKAPEGCTFVEIFVDKGNASGWSGSSNFHSVSVGKYEGTTWTGNSQVVTFYMGVGSTDINEFVVKMEVVKD